MHAKRQRNLELAHAVLAWNQRHLNHRSVLSNELVAECFAKEFVVEPNGRHYAATLDSYREFLEGMKQHMEGIRYDIQHSTADRLVYISCDPATWARDVGDLVRHGWKLTEVTPHDFYPQTSHVEIVSVLNR